MSAKETQADYTRTALRLPQDLHRAVHAAARAGDRTFNSQILSVLRAALMPRAEGGGRDQRGA